MAFIHVPALLDFFSHLFHTVFITDGRLIQWSKNTKLVRNMTDSDLLDMHYFLTEDDDFDDEEFEEGFYIDLF